MFSLAIQGARITTRPHISKLREAQPVQGFFGTVRYLVGPAYHRRTA